MGNYPVREPTKFLHFLESRLPREASEKVLELLAGRFNRDNYGSILHLYGAPMTGKTTFGACVSRAYPMNVIWGMPTSPKPHSYNKIVILDGEYQDVSFEEIETLKSYGYLVIILDNVKTINGVDYSYEMIYTKDFDKTIWQESKDIRKTITGGTSE